jgi:hypothetical protein
MTVGIDRARYANTTDERDDQECCAKSSRLRHADYL